MTSRIHELRAKGLTHYAIAKTLNLSLSEVRRALDPRAQRLHEQWKR